MERINIAIDGPAGAGKSTAAKGIAKALGIRYLDTGAMYRAMALYAKRQGVAFDDEEGLTRILPDADIVVRFTDEGQRVLLGGEDVTGLLRTPEMSMGASTVSIFPPVRKKLTLLQRQVARDYDVVMDGREIGTNVLPECRHKFFITASPEVRARRRHAELVEKGDRASTFEEVLAELMRRDEQDSNRAYMPLRQAEDAILVDTTALDAEQMIARLLTLFREAEK